MVLLLNMGRQLIRRSECSRKGGMDAIKLEGGSPSRITAAKSLVEAVIAVMGHVGLTPQAISVLGGFRPQGKSVASAVKVVETAMALQEVGCFSVVLECVPAPVAAAATSAPQIPTIGIGAGPFCSGQTRVMAGSPQSPLCCCRTSCEDSSSYNSVQVLGVGK